MKNSLFLFPLAATLFASSCANAQAPATASQAPQLPPVVTWKFNLDHAAKETSAGVYDATGKLVRVLWTMKPMAQGEQYAGWDGKDNDGKSAPTGKYTYKVVVNNSTYKNVGVIGNSGTNTFTEVPNNFESVAVDKEGNAYTVHDWYEPHQDVKMWDAKTGQVVAHSGHPIGGLLKAVAVDEQYAYTTSYENLDNRKEAKFYINRLKIDKTPGATNWPIVPFTKAGNAIMVYNGATEYPAGATDAEKGVMRMPLLSLAVSGDTLYATDSLAGKVRMFNKESGEETGALNVKLPQAVAVGDDGRIWVGHEHSQVSIFDKTGKMLGTPVTDVKEVNALAVRGNTLYIADQGAGQIKIYDLNGNDAKMNRTFGDKARPGDRASHRFFNLHGLAVDKSGNLVTAQDEYFFNGGRLAKFSPEGKPLWEKAGLEFVSNGTYSATNPDWFISLQHHGYALDRKTGTAVNTGNTYSGEGYKTTIGPISARKIGGKEFVFMANGDGMLVYRVVPAPDKFRGPSLRLASIVAGSNPLPNGTTVEFWKPENFFLWSWHDEKGAGKVDQSEVVFAQKPGDGQNVWQHGYHTPDKNGNLWFASYDRGGATPESTAIYVIPNLGLDKMGNPTYDWSRALRAIPKTAFPADCQPRQANLAADGTLYVYATSSKPETPHSAGLHMGGNMILKFDMKGFDPAKWKGKDAKDRLADFATAPIWSTVTPEMYVGLDIIPPRADGKGAGLVIGGTPFRGGVSHYLSDGLLIGGFNSDEKRFGGVKDDGQWPSGLIDFFGGVSAQRDPRDGMLDVFVEDDFNNRIFWYRADDHDVQTLGGTLGFTGGQ